MDYTLLALEKTNHVIHNGSPEARCTQARIGEPH